MNPLWSWRPWERSPGLYQDFNQLNFILAAPADHSPLGWIWNCLTAKGGGHLKGKKTQFIPGMRFFKCEWDNIPVFCFPGKVYAPGIVLTAWDCWQGWPQASKMFVSVKMESSAATFPTDSGSYESNLWVTFM